MHDVHGGNWTREPLVTVETLESLRELNHRFIDLVSADDADWHMPRRTVLAPALCGQLAPLSPMERKAIAGCPYALFDLRFDDADHWRLRLTTTAQWSVCEAAVRHEPTLDFVRLALFFAWHVASTAGLAARFLLGMNEQTAAAFRGATIDCISALAASESSRLTARWSDCTTYWDALTRAAARPNSAQLRRVQLSGLQLAAAVQLP